MSAPARVVKEWSRPELTAPRPREGPEPPWPSEGEGPGEGTPRLYVHVDILANIDRRAQEGALRRREDMALLIGDWARDEEGRVYAVAWDMPTGPLEASPVSVRFKPEGLVQVASWAQERNAAASPPTRCGTLALREMSPVGSEGISNSGPDLFGHAPGHEDLGQPVGE